MLEKEQSLKNDNKDNMGFLNFFVVGIDITISLPSFCVDEYFLERHSKGLQVHN